MAYFQLTFSSPTSLKEWWFEQGASLDWSELWDVSARDKVQTRERKSPVAAI